MTPTQKYRSTVAEKASHALLAVSVVAGLAVGIWMAGSSSAGAFGAIVLFIIGLAVGTLVFAMAIWIPIDRILMTPAGREQEREAAATAQATAAWVPITQWRGISHMTRAATVDCKCTRCQREWVVEGKVANTIADAQGLSNRLIRGGTKTEQLGATFTAGASGRRIAAGLESERQQRELAMKLSLGRCPSCGQIDTVQLRRS